MDGSNLTHKNGWPTYNLGMVEIHGHPESSRHGRGLFLLGESLFFGCKIHGPWLSMRFATEDILKLTTGGSGFSAHNDVEAKAKCRGYVGDERAFLKRGGCFEDDTYF